MEGKKTHDLCFLGIAVLIIGKNDVHFRNLALIITVQQNVRNFSRPVKGRILRRIAEGLLNRNMVRGKIMTPAFPDYEKEVVVMLGKHSDGFLDYVLVIGTGQTLIRSDHQISVCTLEIFNYTLRVKIAALYVLVDTENSLNLMGDGIEIRTRGFEIFLRLT